MFPRKITSFIELSSIYFFLIIMINDNRSVLPILRKRTGKNLVNIDITEPQIVNIIEKLNPSKSHVYDVISMKKKN